MTTTGQTTTPLVPEKDSEDNVEKPPSKASRRQERQEEVKTYREGSLALLTEIRDSLVRVEGLLDN